MEDQNICSILNSISSPVIVIRKKIFVEYINDSFKKIFSSDNDLVTGIKFSEFIKNIEGLAKLPDYTDINKLNNLFIKVKKGVEKEYLLKVSKVSCRNNYHMLEFINQTVQNLAIEQLKKSENQLRLVIDNLPFDLWAMDNSWKYSLQNSSSKEKWGDIIGKGIEDLGLSDKLEEEWKKQDEKVFQGETLKPQFSIEGENDTSYFESIITPIIFNKNIEGILGLTLDITDRVKVSLLQEKLIKQNKALLDNISDIAWLKDKNKKFICVNKAFEDFYNITSEEVIGIDSLTLFNRKNIILEDMKEIYSDKNTSIKEKKIHINNEVIITETIVSSIVNNDEIIGFTGVSRNITKRILIENERLKREKLESLGIMAGGIAHDFNNILMGVLGNVQLAKESAVDNEFVQETLTDAEKFIFNAKNMVKDLISLTKGKKNERKNILVSDLLDDILKKHSDIKIEEIKNINQITISVNKVQIHQVLMNIIKNATEAIAEAGEIILTTDILHLDDNNIYVLPKGEYAVIKVKDTGCGIDENDKKHIFEPYFSTKEFGTGLGLASSYSIIKDHGGTLVVDSLKDEWTVMTIILPVFS